MKIQIEDLDKEYNYNDNYKTFFLDIDISKEEKLIKQEKLTVEEVNKTMDVIWDILWEYAERMKKKPCVDIDASSSGKYEDFVDELIVYFIVNNEEKSIKRFKSYFYRFRKRLREMRIVE